jgi:pyruvate/2-oxoglutarate dehydrogenase complex dihydrolipoamide acyltransferase (E2) component
VARPQHASLKVLVPAALLAAPRSRPPFSHHNPNQQNNQTGDSVVENETIAQIETDKVTIDVKAPQDGVVVGFSVKEQDTVVPGQALATLDATAAAAEAASAASAAATLDAAAASASAASGAQDAQVHGQDHAEAHPGRRPAIRFPRRTTADGRRISSLPAAEAAAAAAGGGAVALAAKAAAPSSSSPQPAPAAVTKGASPPPAAAASAAAAQALRGSGVVAGARPRARVPLASPLELGDRALSQLEMDMIELGGAMPYEKKEKKKKG